MPGLNRDLRSAWRFLASSPGWTAVAVVSLALGIGVNTVVFSIVEAVLLRPFPYRNPEEIVLMWGSRSLEGGSGFSVPDIESYRDQSTTLVAAAPYLTTTTMSPGDEPAVPVSRVGDNLFDVLGVRPLVGRGFEASDGGGLPLPGATGNVVILSYGFWQSRFGGDPDILGQALEINSAPYEIVGVMPRGFFFPEHNVEFWLNLPLSDQIRASRTLSAFRAVARLIPGTPIETAQAEIDVINRNLDTEFPRSANVPEALRETAAASGFGGFGGRVTGLFPVHETAVSNYGSVLWMLLGAVGLVLLIACANVANLLLARSVARQKELALRATLGAGRLALLRQLLVESLLLSSVAGVVALAIGLLGIRVVLGLGLIDIPRIESASMNWAVLAFAAGVAILTGLASGLVPAWRASRVNLTDSLKQGGQTSSQSGNRRLRDALVVVEVALALVLLVGAGLLTRSSIGLSRIEWGFDARDLSVVQIRGMTGSPTQRIQFAETVLERLKQVPQIRAASAGMSAPLVPSGVMSERVVADGNPVATAVTAPRIIATRDYFRALGVEVEGREFEETDDARGQRVAVLSRSLARELFPDSDPVGKTIHFATVKEGVQGSGRGGIVSLNGGAVINIQGILGGGSENINDYEVTGQTAHTVIGVAADLKMSDDPSEGPAGPTVYVDYRQLDLTAPTLPGNAPAGLADLLLGSRMNPGVLVVRSDGNTDLVVDAVKRTILDINPELSFVQAAPMEDLVSRALGGAGSNKLMLVLSLVFGALSLVLAAAGIYGVMSHGVSQRKYEIGVRLAIGAEPRDILMMVLKRGLLLGAVGLAIGLGAAWAGSRLLESMLFGITTTDPATFAGVALFLLLVAGAASFVPARRASTVDPLIATRSE